MPRKRHNAIQTIAKTLRTKAGNSIQTSLRNGRRDFILRQKTKGDNTPWGQIPPINLDENLPDFEIGEYNNIYKDDIKYTEEENEKENSKYIEDMDEDEQRDISNEIRRQYQNSNNKRNHSTTPDNTLNPKTKKKLTFQPPGTDSDTEGESEVANHDMSTTIKTILHSTAREECLSTSHTEEHESKTVPETPDIPQILVRYHSEIPQKSNFSTLREEKPIKNIAHHHGQ